MFEDVDTIRHTLFVVSSDVHSYSIQNHLVQSRNPALDVGTFASAGLSGLKSFGCKALSCTRVHEGLGRSLLTQGVISQLWSVVTQMKLQDEMVDHFCIPEIECQDKAFGERRKKEK